MIDWLLISLMVIFSVAFTTLLERKILGSGQFRLGPNKVSLSGLMQPLGDAMKLLIKEEISPLWSNKVLFNISALLSLFLFLILLNIMPSDSINIWSSVTVGLMLAILSFNVYPVFLGGWSSNSSYAQVGSLRGVSQTISYEISLAFILLSFLTLSMSFMLKEFQMENIGTKSVMVFTPIFILLFMSLVAETNRSPFDFAEGESELVSGFNVEYGSVKFSLIFLAEYGMIVFSSIMISLFLGIQSFYLLIGFLFSSSVVYLWVWIRVTYPRLRYDLLMMISWKSVLPFVLGFLCYLMLITYIM